MTNRHQKKTKKKWKWLSLLGPGLTTGAANDDPSGIAAVPLLYLIIKIATNDQIMGEYKSGWLSKTLLWATFLIMAAAAISLIINYMYSVYYS